MPKLEVINNAAASGGGIWAPLANLGLAANALDRALHRSPNLPGVVILSGPSGYGKTMSAAYCANKFNGVYVECRSFFTKKALMLAILKEMGIRPGRNMQEMLDQIVEGLQLSGRPLIVDEADYIVEKNVLEVVRDIHDAAQGAILLIGEEQFPKKLQRWERFHNRVLVWQPAAPAGIEDAKKLARFYAPQIEIADDLLAHVLERSRAVVRRICVNVDLVRDFAGKTGAKRVDRAAWGERDLYTGDAPSRRL
ncbi:MAG: ATP-binding protein [Betaproteobacteria bacterium]|nr:ATP-binding protein [Betaproteobacteria bacterium]